LSFSIFFNSLLKFVPVLFSYCKTEKFYLQQLFLFDFINNFFYSGVGTGSSCFKALKNLINSVRKDEKLPTSAVEKTAK